MCLEYYEHELMELVAAVSLYQGFLMVGYATVYTMLPVFF